jgi:rhodanese-related sulfurtransferase
MRWSKILQILAISLALSAYSAYTLAVRPRDLVPPSGEVVRDTSIPLVRLAEAESLWHDSSTIFIDVRPASDYDFGHIAGAVHLPEPEFEQRFPNLKPRLEGAQAIVVYCKSPDCGLSLWAAIRLRNEGLMQTRIFPGGWNEWYNNGLPTSGAGR